MDKDYSPEKIISILKSARLFNQFDEVQLTQLMAFATIEHFQNDAKIIREKRINKDIYILLKGSLVIYVGDELISKLRRKGDIIGEVSVITRSLTTASVVAATPSVLYKIPSHKIYESDQEELRSQWFKIFSDILAQKLSMTTQKVVGFHEASAKLDKKKKELIRKTLILQSVLGSMDDAVVVTDGSGGVLHTNQAFIRMVGGAKVPSRIENWPEKIGFYKSDGKTACKVRDLPMTGAENGSPVTAEEFYIKNESMETGIWLQATASLLKTGDGNQLEGWVVVFRNITKKKLEEKALIRAKEDAEAAARAKSDFLAVMSHELRTPLNAILGMSDLLASTGLSSEQTRYLDTISNGGRVLLTKIKNILYYNALESGDVRMKKQIFSLKDTIDHVIELRQPAAREKNLTLNADICRAAQLTLSGDKEKITGIMENLLDNAVRYTQKGEIRVSVDIAEQNNASVKFRIAVKDTGIGMRKEIINNLIQPFSQADGSLSRKFEGTGLGLSITKKLVEMMGGGLAVESIPGKGSCFEFTLILSKMENNGGQKKTEAKSSTRSLINKEYADRRPLRILVAEDNKVNQLLIKKVLANLGYQIDIARNGVEAVEACKNHLYDLVLMDIQMPELDGLSASKLILGDDTAKSYPDIIAMTANTSEGIRETCLSAGMFDYISKPFDVNTLITVLERLQQPS
ncbi:MAG: response regulator [Desulfobacteraceae bacterium]|nr:response regulator [Desulfobacteraceae bacterium]